MLCLSTTTLNGQFLTDMTYPGYTEEVDKSGYSISGIVLDEDTDEPIMFANVALYSEQGVLFKGAETDLQGRYTLNNIENGKYYITFSFIGYESKNTIEFQLNHDLVDKDIKLEEDTYIGPMFMNCFGPFKKPFVKTTTTKNTNEEHYTLSGQILDDDTKEPVLFASVALYNTENKLISGSETDLEGRYTINNIPKGEYHIEPSFTGYYPRRVTGITINKNILDFDIEIKAHFLKCYEFRCGGFKKPLIRQDDTTSGMTLTSEDIRPTYSLHYSRPAKIKRKRTKKKKVQKIRKENIEEKTSIASKELTVLAVEIKKEVIDIHIYPNPTFGLVYIEASTEIEKIDVLNVEGKIILTLLSVKESGLDLSQLHAGTYFLRFHHKKGVQTEKLIMVDSQ